MSTLRFSLSEPVGENVLIPQGTRATSDSTHYFETTAAAVIEVGETFIDVDAKSVDGGAAYNGIPIGGINSLVDPVVYVDRVSNTTETSGGGDEETDDSYRCRRRCDPCNTDALAECIEYGSPRISEHFLPRRVVQGIVHRDEHRDKSFGEHPALVARVKRRWRKK